MKNSNQQSNQQVKQKKLPIETIIIQKEVSLVGYSFMFPKGSKAFIQKKTIDPNENETVYQGTFFNKDHGICSDVSFDVDGKHLKHNPPSYDSNGHLVPSQSAFAVKLDLSEI